jgi:hypothetical protein
LNLHIHRAVGLYVFAHCNAHGAHIAVLAGHRKAAAAVPSKQALRNADEMYALNIIYLLSGGFRGTNILAPTAWDGLEIESVRRSGST